MAIALQINRGIVQLTCQKWHDFSRRTNRFPEISRFDGFIKQMETEIHLYTVANEYLHSFADSSMRPPERGNSLEKSGQNYITIYKWVNN